MPVNDPFAGFFLIAGLVFAGFFVLLYFGTRARDRRARELEQWAASKGWHYAASDPSLVTLWDGPPFEGRGKATDVITGQYAERPFTTFTYTYTTGSGDDERTYHYVITAMRLPDMLPMLWIEPESVSRRLMTRLGTQDIDFESTAFNKAFAVQADDERYAYAVIHPRMMEYLMASPLRQQGVRIHGDTVLTWSRGEVELQRVEPAVRDVAGFVDLIPRHALKEHSVEVAPTGFAGSVTGLSRDKTPAGLWGAGFLILIGVAWWAITTPIMSSFEKEWNSFGMASGDTDMFPTVIFVVAPLVGVALAVLGAVQLVRGLLAVRRYKRDRERRLNGPQAE